MMGLESAVKAVEAYMKVASERVNIGINVDPSVVNVFGAFIFLLVFGHRISEAFFRRGMGETYDNLSASARTGIMGLFFFSSLALVPLFTYLDIALGIIATVVLLMVVPYYQGQKIGEEVRRKLVKRQVRNSTPSPFTNMTEKDDKVAPPGGAPVERRIFDSVAIKLRVLRAKVLKFLAKLGRKKEGAPPFPKAPVIKKSRGRAITLEEVNAESGKIETKNIQKTTRKIPLLQIRKTAKIEEVKIGGEVTEPQQVKKPEDKKQESIKEPEVVEERETENVEVSEEVQTFRGVLDTIEGRYINAKEKEGQKNVAKVLQNILPKKKEESESDDLRKEGQKNVAKVLQNILPKKKEEAEEKTTATSDNEEVAEPEKVKRGISAVLEKILPKNKEDTEERKQSGTYKRIKTMLRNILLEREKAKLARVTWRDMREIRKKVDQDVERYHDKIAEEAAKLGKRAGRSDIYEAARRIIGLDGDGPQKQEALDPDKKKRDEDITDLLGEDDGDIASLLGEGEDDDISKLLKG